MWLRLPSPDDVFAFRALDRDWSVDARAESFLRPLLDGEALGHCRIHELAEGNLHREEVDRLVMRLVRDGLLALG